MKRNPWLKFSVLLVLGLLCSTYSLAQLQTYHFNELDSLNEHEKKSVVVFIHTDWCKYCLQMEHTTFANDSIAAVLNRHFYFVKLDAETHDSIRYGGHTFRFKPNGANTGIHELAEQLGTIDGKLVYPTLAILNDRNEVVFKYAGLLTSEELLAGLRQLVNQ